MKPHVSIVIVTWNGKRQTLQCLTSLEKVRHNSLKLDIVVVDNGSTDGTREALAKDFPSILVISLPTNRGFTGGSNVGISQALRDGSDYVWLLNNDTYIAKNALSLLGVFDDPLVGIAGSKIYFAPHHEYHKSRYAKDEQGKVLWYGGGYIDWDNMYASHRGVDEVDHGQYNQTEETAFVTGCSMMIARTVFDRIGLFDEAYYLYLEDVDFCLRAKRAGFTIVYVPSSVVWHSNAQSSGGAGSQLHQYYLTRNRYLIGLRYAPLRTKIALAREGTKFLIAGSPLQKRAVLDAIIGRFGMQYES